MSVLVVPNVAKRILQIYTTGLGPPGTWTIKLFSNNATISAATVLSDLTEATFSGYAAINLSGLAVDASLDAFNRAVATWNPATWTKSGVTGNTIYGYYVIQPGPALMWAEKFDFPIPMTTDGAYLVITPRFTYTSQF